MDTEASKRNRRFFGKGVTEKGSGTFPVLQAPYPAAWESQRVQVQPLNSRTILFIAPPPFLHKVTTYPSIGGDWPGHSPRSIVQYRWIGYAMPRQPRLEIVGLPHHIVQRGVDRQAVFFDHRCYLEYLHLLDEYASHLEISVHSWCLMTNHVHLLLTPSIPRTLSRLMQNLNRVYVQRINACFERLACGLKSCSTHTGAY